MIMKKIKWLYQYIEPREKLKARTTTGNEKEQKRLTIERVWSKNYTMFDRKGTFLKCKKKRSLVYGSNRWHLISQSKIGHKYFCHVQADTRSASVVG